MGQRSHLVIGYKGHDYEHYRSIPVQKRYVRYLHWNWGEYMIIRAAQVIRYHKLAQEPYAQDSITNAQGALAMFCVNLTTGVTQGLAEGDDMSDCKASEWSNNNGAFVIDMGDNGEYHFGFLAGREENSSVNGRKVKPLDTVLTAREYLTVSGVELWVDEEAICNRINSYSLTEDEKRERIAAELEFRNGRLRVVLDALEVLEEAEKSHKITRKRTLELINMTSSSKPLEDEKESA